MIVHIFNKQLKFSKGYFKFLSDSGFDLSNMKLIHYGKKDSFFSNELNLSNYFINSYASIRGNIKLLFDLFYSEKIIIHSLASPALIFYLTIFPKLQEKTVWIIWGKDLHFYHLIKNKKFYHKIYEWFRIRSIRNIGTIVTSIREDYEILKSYYDVNGNYIECNALYFYSFDSTLGKISTPGPKKTILLGNSGSQTNNHIDAIKTLHSRLEEIEKVFCPLSYGGNKQYQKKVIEFGQKELGEKFIPLIDFMSLDQYKKLLSEIDIGIFNHDRQEGLANIWSLMFLGKTIYLKKNNPSASHFERNKIKVKYIENIQNFGLCCNSYEELEKNQYLLKDLMSAENSIKAWENIMKVRANRQNGQNR